MTMGVPPNPMRQGSVTYAGKSGEQYHFQAWSLDVMFKPVAAVYFYTRRSYGNGTYRRANHEIIHIGHAADLSSLLTTKTERYREAGANCICVHLVADDPRREAIERDLQAMHGDHPG